VEELEMESNVFYCSLCKPGENQKYLPRQPSSGKGPPRAAKGKRNSESGSDDEEPEGKTMSVSVRNGSETVAYRIVFS
jgi:hypothetical protein